MRAHECDGRFGVTAVSATRPEGLRAPWGGGCRWRRGLKLSCHLGSFVGSRRRLGFFGVPGAACADFVLARVVLLPLFRCVCGGLAQHGGGTRPRQVLRRRATCTRRMHDRIRFGAEPCTLNSLEFVSEQFVHVHGVVRTQRPSSPQVLQGRS